MSFDRGFVGEHSAPVLFGGSACSACNGERVGSRFERGATPAERVGEATEPIGTVYLMHPPRRPPKDTELPLCTGTGRLRLEIAHGEGKARARLRLYNAVP